MDWFADPIIPLRLVTIVDSSFPAEVWQVAFHPTSTVILEALIDGSGL